jgi:hypothetical protein
MATTHSSTITLASISAACYLKNYIDGFMIGSELVGLTQYMSAPGVFPAVTQLKNLAASVKATVGAGVKVIYGARLERISLGEWLV